MSNKTKKRELLILSFILIIISMTIVAINNKEFITNVILNESIMQNIVNIIAIISGASGVIIGLSGFRMSSLDAVKEYFQQGDADDFLNARREIYTYNDKKENVPNDSPEASKICSFFHFWGMMAKKRYLPMWVFGSASGISVVKLYNILEGFIREKRKNNPLYAEYFEWLVVKIKKKYRRELKLYNVE